MKLSTNIRQTKEITKNLKIGTNGLEIEANKKDYTIVDVKSIIFFLQAFHIYIQILVFLVILENKLQLQLALIKYIKYLIIL